ncbi:cobalamin synthesis protein P47K [Methylocella silvestris BL2]|uniref:Cobalamin synthesis protein P47K n=1 Tax=Methylocella silvestris (strain DSM 15510 / CIP 108128 / LMG 27833 / NCIMB 13906 / BL2) TaxID=395965 RepID=B8ETJ5_METSB|nr:GTP-binding protein [Methylocella silvestris]ACK52347.1 cobalamin synthesis protein P47K [Methylocella silvestris BL2]
MKKINATIITGFLGAGKTTLLNEILAQAAGERIVVIVNEFGEVGIDGQLVVETAEAIVELNNGCICCTVRGDLVVAISDLIRSDRPIDRLIIETSGLADPAPVIQSFILDDLMSAHVQLDAIVTVVDVRHIARQLQHDEAREQIAFADILLLNKIDLEDEAASEAAECAARRLNPLARFLRTRECAVEARQVLDLGAFDLKNLLALDPDLLADHAHEHSSEIGCVALTIEEGLDPDAFNRWLNRLLQDRGADILRMKGVLNFSGDKRRYVFHGVHMTLDGRPGRPWLNEERRVSQIVFIGRQLDREALLQGLEACRAIATAA